MVLTIPVAGREIGVTLPTAIPVLVLVEMTLPTAEFVMPICAVALTNWTLLVFPEKRMGPWMHAGS